MRTIDIVLIGALAACIAACGSMSPALTTAPSPAVATPTTPPAAAPSVPDSVVSGTWTGTGSDSFSPELVTWVITQSGNALSGTAEINAVNPADGTCGSCHKVKRGTLAGTLSGSALTVSMTFPAGGDVPTPICVAELTAAGTIADRRITATYTGTDTCEGVYSNGVMELTRTTSNSQRPTPTSAGCRGNELLGSWKLGIGSWLSSPAPRRRRAEAVDPRPSAL